MSHSDVKPKCQDHFNFFPPPFLMTSTTKQMWPNGKGGWGHSGILPLMTLNSLYCADMPLSNYSPVAELIVDVIQFARTTLLPGILKTLSCNKGVPLPVRLFEISDVGLKDLARDVCARNQRRLCAVYCDTTSGFEVVHGLLDRTMQLLDIPLCTQENGYRLRPVDGE